MKRAACFDVPAWHRLQLDEYAAKAPELAKVAATGDAKVAGFYGSEAGQRAKFILIGTCWPVAVPILGIIRAVRWIRTGE